jgi:ketosteroid isomerase-like protein
MLTKRNYIPLAILVILFGCNDRATTDIEAEKENLMETSRQWSRQAASGNVDSIVQYWDDDAIVISSGEAPLEGKEAIRNMVKGSFSNPGFKIEWEPEKADIAQSGDLGYLVENTKMTMTDSLGQEQAMHFKAVTIWKKQPDGTWKNVVDVMSALPPSP